MDARRFPTQLNFIFECFYQFRRLLHYDYWFRFDDISRLISALMLFTALSHLSRYH